MVGTVPLHHASPDPASVREITSGRLYWDDYLGAWMLVHVMVLGAPRHRQAFERYLDVLRSGGLGGEDSFGTYFDQKALAEIDAAYAAFQKRESTPTLALAMSVPATLEVSSRPLSTTEVLALRGRLWRSDPPGQMHAMDDANHAVWSNPESPEGYLLRAIVFLDAGNHERAVNELRVGLERAPDDVRLQSALGSILLAQVGPTAEVRNLAGRVGPRARAPEDHRFLARWELSQRQPSRALELAARGVALDVGCIACYLAAADAAHELGDRDAAFRWQERGVNIAAEDASESMLRYLEFYRKRAKARGTAPANTAAPR
jgi:tetratricopeptide (TPR) repeat protein